MRNEPLGSVGRVYVLDRSTWSAIGPCLMDFFRDSSASLKPHPVLTIRTTCKYQDPYETVTYATDRPGCFCQTVAWFAEPPFQKTQVNVTDCSKTRLGRISLELLLSMFISSVCNGHFLS